MFGPAGEPVRSPLCGQCRKKDVEGCCPRVPSDHHLPEPSAAVISGAICARLGLLKPCMQVERVQEALHLLSMEGQLTVSGQERHFFTSGLHMLLEATQIKLIDPPNQT